MIYELPPGMTHEQARAHIAWENEPDLVCTNEECDNHKVWAVEPDDPRIFNAIVQVNHRRESETNIHKHLALDRFRCALCGDDAAVIEPKNIILNHPPDCSCEACLAPPHDPDCGKRVDTMHRLPTCDPCLEEQEQDAAPSAGVIELADLVTDMLQQVIDAIHPLNSPTCTSRCPDCNEPGTPETRRNGVFFMVCENHECGYDHQWEHPDPEGGA